MIKIKYIVPEFMWFSRNEIIIKLFEKYPKILLDDISIYSIYGVFPNAIWNGGGYSFYYKNYSVREMRRVRNFYNKRGIVITFTFTNQLITEEHIHDDYCNQMLKIFHNGMNEVLIVSPILEKYIRKNYPKYKINRSIINTEKVPFLLDNYHLTVLSKFKNKDFEFLKSLSEEEKSRTELLCDEFCVNECPYKYLHYKEYAYIQLYGQKPNNAHSNFAQCRFNKGVPGELYSRINDSVYKISYNDIVNTYLPLGFQFFKLSGRGITNNPTLLKLMD